MEGKNWFYCFSFCFWHQINIFILFGSSAYVKPTPTIFSCLPSIFIFFIQFRSLVFVLLVFWLLGISHTTYSPSTQLVLNQKVANSRQVKSHGQCPKATLIGRLAIHKNLETLNRFKEAGITCLYFPAYTSHFIQPLDNDVFVLYGNSQENKESQQGH